MDAKKIGGFILIGIASAISVVVNDMIQQDEVRKEVTKQLNERNSDEKTEE